MTKKLKIFIENNIDSSWMVYKLCLVKDPVSTLDYSKEIPFSNISDVLCISDILYFIQLTETLAYTFLPANSEVLFQDLNDLLKEEFGYYIAIIMEPGLNVDGIANDQEDLFIQIDIRRLRVRVKMIKAYIHSQRKPKFSQDILDDILDELSEKTFDELSRLRQIQLKHFSGYLTYLNK